MKKLTIGTYVINILKMCADWTITKNQELVSNETLYDKSISFYHRNK